MCSGDHGVKRVSGTTSPSGSGLSAQPASPASGGEKAPREKKPPPPPPPPPPRAAGGGVKGGVKGQARMRGQKLEPGRAGGANALVHAVGGPAQVGDLEPRGDEERVRRSEEHT